MENINTYLTNIDEDINNFKHDDIQPYILDYKRMNIFNSNIKRPGQKIWLLTPKLKILGKIYIPNNKKQVALLSLILYDHDDDVKKFKEFIENLESYITTIIHEKYDNELILKSCIKNCETFFPSFTIQMPFINKSSDLKFNFDIYNVNNKKISYNDIDSGSFTKSYIELSDIWISGKEFGCNWKVLQMKIYPEFDFNKCLFDDGISNIDGINEDNEENQNNIPSPPPFIKDSSYKGLSKPPPIPPQIKKSNIKTVEKHKVSFTPTAQELSNMLSKLKKIKKDDDDKDNVDKYNFKEDKLDTIIKVDDIDDGEVEEIQKPIIKPKGKKKVRKIKKNISITQ